MTSGKSERGGQRSFSSGCACSFSNRAAGYCVCEYVKYYRTKPIGHGLLLKSSGKQKHCLAAYLVSMPCFSTLEYSPSI